MTTIYTLSKELNMTPSMISRAFSPNGKISEEKRKIILEVANKYGFTPNKFASRLSMKNIRIGILINSRFAVNTDKMISGIESAYEKLKDYKIQYDITIMNSLENESENHIEILNRYKNYNGVIVAGMSSEKYTNMLNALCEENVSAHLGHASIETTSKVYAHMYAEVRVRLSKTVSNALYSDNIV